MWSNLGRPLSLKRGLKKCFQWRPFTSVSPTPQNQLPLFEIPLTNPTYLLLPMPAAHLANPSVASFLEYRVPEPKRYELPTIFGCIYRKPKVGKVGCAVQVLHKENGTILCRGTHRFIIQELVEHDDDDQPRMAKVEPFFDIDHTSTSQNDDDHPLFAKTLRTMHRFCKLQYKLAKLQSTLDLPKEIYDPARFDLLVSRSLEEMSQKVQTANLQVSKQKVQTSRLYRMNPDPYSLSFLALDLCDIYDNELRHDLLDCRHARERLTLVYHAIRKSYKALKDSRGDKSDGLPDIKDIFKKEIHNVEGKDDVDEEEAVPKPPNPFEVKDP